MDNYRKSAHATYKCKYHFVWIPKYRFRVLAGEIKEELKKIIMEICDSMEIVIMQGNIQQDHVHLYISVPPRYSPSEVMKKIKGKSAERLWKRFPELRKRYWGQHVWARGYFVTTGGIEDGVIKKYIQEQEDEERKIEQLKLWGD